MRPLSGDGTEHPPARVHCKKIAARLRHGDEKIRAAIGRNETSGQFLLCSDSGQAERGREIAADRGAGADSSFLSGDISRGKQSV